MGVNVVTKEDLTNKKVKFDKYGSTTANFDLAV